MRIEHSTVWTLNVPQPPRCEHQWGTGGRLQCVRPRHADPGHVYHSTTGSDVDDDSLDGGHG